MQLIFIPVGGAVSASMPYGSYYISASAGTPNVSGTPIKLAGTTTALLTNLFTHIASNRLRYDGADTRRFEINVALSSISDTNNVVQSAFIYKTGAQQAPSEVTRKIAVMSDVGSTSLTFQIELAEDDYIEIWIDTDAGNPTITADKMIVTVHAID